MWKVVTQFFKEDSVLPHYNSNTIVFILNIKVASSVDHYRQIALANFKHKIITKIMVDSLTYLLPKIISTEQNVFINGRRISDYIFLAFEATNLLNKKAYVGHVALKIDISKALSLCRQIFIDILIVFCRVMTFAYDVSFVFDMHKPTLSTLTSDLFALLDLFLISFVDCEV